MIPHTAALLYEVIANKEADMAGLRRICKAHGGMSVTAHGETVRYDAEGKIMPLKPRVKVKARGIPIGSYDVIKDNAGKQLVKPKVKRKGATLNQQYASKNRRRYKPAK